MDTIKTPKEVIQEHLTFLRSCAERIVEHGEKDGLTSIENIWETLMREFLSIGRSFGLTERDMVVMVYKGILTPGKILG